VLQQFNDVAAEQSMLVSDTDEYVKSVLPGRSAKTRLTC